MSDQQVRMLQMKLHNECCANAELRQQLEKSKCECYNLQRHCEDMECKYQYEIDRLHQEIKKLHAQYRK